MKLKETDTPESTWNRVKNTLLKGNVNESLDKLMLDSFKEAEDEGEKWLKLGIFLKALQDKLDSK